MASRYSLGRPHPNHSPHIGTYRRGFTHHAWGNGESRGTTLSCSCGWKPKGHGRVSTSPPSRGGRADANAAYRAHVAEVLR